MQSALEVIVVATVVALVLAAVIILSVVILGSIYGSMLIASVHRHLEMSRYRTAEQLRSAMAREPYLLYVPSASQLEYLALSIGARSGVVLMRECPDVPGQKEYMLAMPAARSKAR